MNFFEIQDTLLILKIKEIEMTKIKLEQKRLH